MNALPTPKSIRRQWLILRIMPVLALALVFSLANRFSQPSNLEWWTSPEFGSSRHRVRLLIPHGWEVSTRVTVSGSGDLWQQLYEIVPKDNRPTLLRRLFPNMGPLGHLALEAGTKPSAAIKSISIMYLPGAQILNAHDNPPEKSIDDIRTNTWAKIYFMQPKRRGINATYMAICNSLKLE